jgi:hypothetical protein
MEDQFDIGQEKMEPTIPEELPSPTYWPFYLAMGIMFSAWGLLTMWEFSLLGLILIVISLVGWINILRHER